MTACCAKLCLREGVMVFERPVELLALSGHHMKMFNELECSQLVQCRGFPYNHDSIYVTADSLFSKNK